MKVVIGAAKNILYKVQKKIHSDPSKYSTIVGKGSIVPVQIEAYLLALRYVKTGYSVLDVGFGLGYGLNILSICSEKVSGVDIDPLVLDYCKETWLEKNPKLENLALYDGYHLDYPDNHFDIVTSVDVIEHVEDYEKFLVELLRVSKKGVFISTPNRRKEYTNRDGSPKNYWHLREWNFTELDEIVKKYGNVEWKFISGAYDGPFSVTPIENEKTLALCPFIKK